MAHFKFSPQVLARLGEELISSVEQGIIELVKNSYDADAKTCIITLASTIKVGGEVTISDDGIGMDSVGIAEQWFLIGGSQKLVSQPTESGRIPAGSKGLGRLAALRQGSEVSLYSRPKHEPGIEYYLNIDWDKFSNVTSVDSVDFQVQSQPTDKSHGTDIIISNLLFSLSEREVKKLARELILLSDPFDNQTGFQPVLVAPEFQELEQRVRNAYFDSADFYLTAHYNDAKEAEFKLYDFSGKIISTASNNEILNKYKHTYPNMKIDFDFWVFILDKESFSTRKVSINEVSTWLDDVGNISLYHRNLRIRPYGDSDNDWLEINKMRGRTPMTRPATRTSVGKIAVDDPNELLLQKTDRIGLIENEAFYQLKEFAQDALRWMASFREKEAEIKRGVLKERTTKKLEVAKDVIVQAIQENVPLEARPAVEEAYKKFEQAIAEEYRVLKEDIQLYRSLATVGTTSATFAHESGRRVQLIDTAISQIEDRARKFLKDDYEELLEKPILRLRLALTTIKNFVRFPIHLLKRRKRRPEILDVHNVIDECINLFEPFFVNFKIKIELERNSQNSKVYGSIALVESVLTNLLTNALNAFNAKGARSAERIIIIRTEDINGFTSIKVIDNGLGIQGVVIDEIWSPGITTTPDGTGLGLTIVRDCIKELDGTVSAIANGELGGAEFVVLLPNTETAKVRR